jgi:HEAT repeat protein
MHQAQVFGLAVVALFLLFHPLAADDRSPADTQQWLAQLGDDAYQVREHATRQLIERGLAARPAVLAALEDPDPEVRLRCQRILAEIEAREETRILQAFLEEKDPDNDHGLSGWPAFRELAGDSPETRKLYAQLYQAERNLLSAVGRRGRDLHELFSARLTEVLQNMRVAVPGGTATRQVPLLTAMALLFVAGDERVDLENTSVQTLVIQSEVQQRLAAGEDRDLLRKLLGRVVAREVAGTAGYQNMILAMRFDLKEALQPALKLAREDKASGIYRLYALLAVAKFGSREDVAAIEPLLTDATVVYTRGGAGARAPQFQTQVRDAALAVLIHLQGGKLEEFGMAVRPAAQYIYQPTSLGFANDDARDAALAKYREWVGTREN